MDYEIVLFTLTSELSMKVLSPIGRPSFMDRLVHDPKKRERATLIARTAEKVARTGIGWAKESKTLKVVTAKVSVFELRIPGKVIRVMAYLHEGTDPIYLFDFDSHAGKSGKIPPAMLDRANRLAEVARNCIVKGGSSC